MIRLLAIPVLAFAFALAGVAADMTKGHAYFYRRREWAKAVALGGYALFLWSAAVGVAVLAFALGIP